MGLPNREFKLKIFVLVVFYFTVPAKSDFCANPKPSDNPVDIKWMHEHFQDGWNLQFMPPEGRAVLAQFLVGFDNKVQDDFSKMCARLKLDYVDDHFTGLFIGYGGKESRFNCSHSLACTLTSSDKSTAVPVQAHISYFDGKGKDDHNFVTVINCMQTGESFWYAMTRSITMSDAENKVLNDHLTAIGYSPDIRAPMQSPSC